MHQYWCRLDVSIELISPRARHHYAVTEASLRLMDAPLVSRGEEWGGQRKELVGVYRG